ncbi:hypothetical protein F441_22036 [Phytophthora nicotianae CJ01A1]|nr:hypothetical protein PPTG_24432 [Phytophthora nicotianae INRA-310]ETL24605.1 hypothetical protein L916_21399 [Phytophthora nicotianae]ETP00554.1 hypothetical protein F441_22036 [Phytophthora nicotianae CJ01A1]ETP43929.1 hypothetical protein F442_09434 [Phytophthora nicotianae P10297]ETL92571.1 hypothetical protein L917_09158 [Phytophthora nicotianae]ETM99343.1 hypothetical protein PPTG_24432 [Phytophthora nicotianae INRA-310]
MEQTGTTRRPAHSFNTFIKTRSEDNCTTTLSSLTAASTRSLRAHRLRCCQQAMCHRRPDSGLLRRGATSADVANESSGEYEVMAASVTRYC